MNATFMRRCTRCAAAMTTRKHAASLLAALALAIVLGGCATPGPLHVYSPETSGERRVQDWGNGGTADVPSFLEPEDELTGFAYDPFTDHFFLRLAPGNKIRVVDRPARKIKREFEIESLPPGRGGDLALRPRDGHLFLLQGPGGEVAETSRFGKPVRTITLSGVSGAPIGLAFDSLQDRLLALASDGRRVTTHDLQGARFAELTLAQPVGGSLAFDAEKRELYAPLRERAGEIGIFDETGKLLRTSAATGTFVDLGVRSFVRVF
jgi:hypothetical protein